MSRKILEKAKLKCKAIPTQDTCDSSSHVSHRKSSKRTKKRKETEMGTSLLLDFGLDFLSFFFLFVQTTGRKFMYSRRTLMNSRRRRSISDGRQKKRQLTVFQGSLSFSKIIFYCLLMLHLLTFFSNPPFSVFLCSAYEILVRHF